MSRVFVCEFCGERAVYSRGKAPRACSDGCREGLGMRIRFDYPEECRVCGVELPLQLTGRPRVYCSPGCSSEAVAARREMARDHLRVRDLEALDSAGVSQDRYSIEKPLPSAGLDRNILGSGDIDLSPYMDQEWAVQFVSEFGYSGCDVGQTYPNAGRTLGSD